MAALGSAEIEVVDAFALSDRGRVYKAVQGLKKAYMDVMTAYAEAMAEPPPPVYTEPVQERML